MVCGFFVLFFSFFLEEKEFPKIPVQFMNILEKNFGTIPG